MKKTTRTMIQKTMKKVIVSTGVLGMILGATGTPFFAHGYVSNPPSRSYVGHTSDRNEAKYGAIMYEPQSLEAPKGFPLNGPRDGKIASAEGVRGFELDIQKEKYWVESEIMGGPQNFTWNYKAAHNTAKWHYYMTKKDWNPNTALRRADLELIGEVNHDGSAASNNLTHTIDIPTDREGSHVILAVWDVEDTENAFYNVIDVNVRQDDNGPTIPSPEGLQLIEATHDVVSIGWNKTAATDYAIFRDGVEVGRTTEDAFTDVDVSEGTTYAYYVRAIDATGSISAPSRAITVTTKINPDNQKPLAPTNLHIMDVQDTIVDLMWTGRETGVEYIILRNGIESGRTTKTSFLDDSVQQGTTYTYTVKAIDKHGNESALSNPVTVTTDVKPVLEGRTFEVGTFTQPQLYRVGEKVNHLGKTYMVRQTHNNYGDVTWAPERAASLFILV